MSKNNNQLLHQEIREEDYINQGNINEIKKSHWIYGAIKEILGRNKNSIVIYGLELIDLVITARIIIWSANERY